MPFPSDPGFYPGSLVAFPGFTVTAQQPNAPTTSPPPDTSAPDSPSAADPAALAEWSFVLGPASGGLARELRTATSRKVSFKLGAPSEASCDIDGRNVEATFLVELSTDLHVFRAPSRGARKQRLYRGRIGKSGDTFDADQHKVSVPSLDYRAVLQRRALMSGSQVTWTDQDQAVVAQGLIDQAQRLPGGSYGISLGRASNTGVSRSWTFKLGDSIGSKIQELSEADDGFDWDITPTSASGLQLDIWAPARGDDKQVVLEFGAAVLSGSRTVDSSTYANHVRLNGSQPEGGGTEPPIQERTAADIASRPEGRWDKTYGTQITTAASLVARSEWQIADSENLLPSYDLKLRPGWWRGPDHLWLGDSVLVRVKSGRLRVNSKLRVNSLDVSIGDDGTEDVSVTVGAPKPDYRKRAVDVEQRLTALERL